MKIKKSYIVTFCIIMSFIQPYGLRVNRVIDTFFNIVQLVTTLMVLVKLTKHQLNINLFVGLFMLYRIYVCMVSFFLGVDFSSFLKESILYAVICIHISNLIEKKNGEDIRIIIDVLLFILALNIITYPFSTDYFMIGIRTRICDIAFPSIALSWYGFKKGLIGQLRMKMVLLFSIAFIMLEWVATSMFACLLIALFYLIEKYVGKIFKHWVQKDISLILMYISAGISIAVVFGGIQSKFSFLIETILHKQVTLTGRTEIWAIAIDILRRSPIWGYGFSNGGAFVNLYSFTATAHNQLLQIGYYGGIIGVILFYTYCLFPVIRLIKKKPFENYCMPLISIYFSMLVISTTELCLDTIFNLVLLCVLYYESIKYRSSKI